MFVISCCKRSVMPGNIVVPPDCEGVCVSAPLIHPRNVSMRLRETYNDHVSIQLFSNVNVTLVDRVIQCLMNPATLKAEDTGVKQGLWRTEAFVPDCENLE